MTRGRVAVIAALAGIAARMAHLLAIRNHPYWEIWSRWPNSDMYQFAAWARHLAAGDWMDASAFRPYFDWQQAVAPPEVWNSWYGAGVYYQPPLYPYLAALAYAVTGGFDLFRVAQLILGGVNCGLIALLAARVYDSRAGLIAGLAAALYTPFIVYDAELLRGTVVMTSQLLLLLSMTWTVSASRTDGRHRRAGLTGLAFGVAWLADPAILLFLPPAVVWLVWTLRVQQSKATATSRVLAFLVTGATLAILPLMARNLAVGAPLLSSTTRAPLAFVMGNAPDARPAGAMIPESTGAILGESGYRMGATMGATLRRYQGHYAPLLGKQMEKLSSLWGAYEVPDNPSPYYAARISPMARYGLRFLPVVSLGLIGMVIAVAGARRNPLQALLPLFLVAAMAVFALAHVVSRYRQPMAMALIVMAAGGLSWAIGRGRAATIFCVAAATVTSLVLPWQPPEGYAWNRPAEFVMVARVYVDRGQIDEAVSELRSAVRLAGEEEPIRRMQPVLLFEMGTIQAEAGRYREAVESFEEVIRIEPKFEGAVEALRAAESAAGEAR